MHFKNHFIKNITTQKSYYIGNGKDNYSIDLKNCFIRFFTDGKDKWRISVFDYLQSKVSFYDLKAREPIGYNDTCIFITPNDFKFQKKKYRSGSIISLNENGIKIIKPIFKKYSNFDYNSVFYSNTYKVTKSFLYKFENDCITEDHISLKITYNDNIVDSFEFIQDYYSNPFIQLSSDTLICHSGNGNLGTSTNGTIKKYYKTNLIGVWEQSIYIDSFPILKTKLISYYNIGNLLLLKVRCASTNKAGLKLSDEKRMTLNDIPLKKESTFYNLFFAFDIQKKEFIGYPKIEFLSAK